MSPCKDGSFLVLLALIVFSLGSGDGLNVGAADSSDNLRSTPALSPVGVESPVFKSVLDSPSSLGLSSLPENPELIEYCSELLHMFSQRYEAYVSCLIPAARPVQVCRNCSSGYGDLVKIYANISSDLMGPGNVSCKDSLLCSDRLMVVSVLYSNVEGLWKSSNCEKCITNELQGPTNDTLYFMSTVSQTLNCFEKYQQGNHTELCKNCKSTYRGLNELYSRMENNQTLCIDIEDVMNMTRILWSENFGCSLPREETVPVIAVSSFMLFLPIIFYLSSFLHSEQKKRKLIHPKRAKSYASLMNIQDKMS